MILRFNFEELRALASAGEAYVGGVFAGSSRGPASAPADSIARVEMLLPRLTGDFSIETLEEQRWVREAVWSLCEDLRGRMDEKIIAFSPGHEDAVSLYFEYGHSRTVLNRLDQMGAEMEAILDLMTGGRRELAGSVTFPD